MKEPNGFKEGYDFFAHSAGTLFAFMAFCTWLFSKTQYIPKKYIWFRC